mgnify:CR=1 FL=1
MVGVGGSSPLAPTKALRIQRHLRVPFGLCCPVAVRRAMSELELKLKVPDAALPSLRRVQDWRLLTPIMRLLQEAQTTRPESRKPLTTRGE